MTILKEVMAAETPHVRMDDGNLVSGHSEERYLRQRDAARAKLLGKGAAGEVVASDEFMLRPISAALARPEIDADSVISRPR